MTVSVFNRSRRRKLRQDRDLMRRHERRVLNDPENFELVTVPRRGWRPRPNETRWNYSDSKERR